MKTVNFTKKEYSELLRIKKELERILEAKKEKKSFKEDEFLNAFGILKNSFKTSSTNYISKLRKEWR